jgi:hypothetical protein
MRRKMSSSTILESFKSDLLGLYHNRFQAYSDPSNWAFICVKYYLEDFKLKSKSWHHTYGEQSAYRIFTHDLTLSGDSVVMSNYNEIENEKSCDLIFSRSEDWWVSNNSVCLLQNKDMYVKTFVKFNGIEYHSRDAGYSVISNEFLWGKEASDGEFIFVKQ